ncbi:hypothetical protein FEM48_Zijuj10G0053600 [Ziziphus jujuba var. spinosa]|uniref:Gnk2-homologous domain-containing protein n=1 Tax=Ziziphus jujuba var. spinosa TaxID=714518 RepID=A0A978ULJ1_ZIZJJ|nr:hypothetical protein FEM48_Zijuj10G0053600 [Ziziphus jujuba var. spinosa]
MIFSASLPSPLWSPSLRFFGFSLHPTFYSSRSRLSLSLSLKALSTFLGMFSIPNILLVLLLSLFLLLHHVVSDPRATEAALICSNNTASTQERQIFVANFLATMDVLTPLIGGRGYAAVVNGTGNTTVYSFGECMKDLSQSDCNLCFAQCKTQILRCLPFQKGTRGGRLFYDGCYLRYDDHDFFNQSLSLQDKTVCAKDDFGGNLTVWKANVMELVRNLSLVAPKNDGFSVGLVNLRNVSVYGLAQCWELVNGSFCEECLADAVKEISSCSSKQEGRVLNAGCYLRFSPQKFYYNSTIGNPGNGGNRTLAIILAVVSAVIAVLLASAAVLFFGILSDGKAVAIKRLFFNTTQWVDHFFNEVNLISEIDHRNLVWNLYGTGRLSEAVDPILNGNYRVEEASRLLQIGLLCAQASAELRPSMSTVVKMLTGNHEILHPTQPPFMNSSSTEISPRIPSEGYHSQPDSNTQSSGNRITESWIEPR